MFPPPNIDPKDRIVGCILGGAVGDAVGLPYEGQLAPASFELSGKIISDETQLTIATCEAIVEGGGNVNPATIASSFASWHRDGRIRQMGSSTFKALAELAAGGHWALVGRKGEFAAGNGAAMRIAPLAFCLDPKEPADRTVIRDVSRITHHSEEAFVGALAVTIAVRAAWDGSWCEQSTLLSLVVNSIPDSQVRDRCMQLNEIGINDSIAQVAQSFGCSGHVVESVPLSLYAAQRVSDFSFEELMSQLVGIGGDTDTIASMTGQIAGTVLGVKRLPQHLITQLHDATFIEDIAKKFAGTIVR